MRKKVEYWDAGNKGIKENLENFESKGKRELSGKRENKE